MVLESCTNESTRKAPPAISPKTAGGNQTPSRDEALQAWPRTTPNGNVTSPLPLTSRCSEPAAGTMLPGHVGQSKQSHFFPVHTVTSKMRNIDGQKNLRSLLMKPRRKSKGAFNEKTINPILVLKRSYITGVFSKLVWPWLDIDSSSYFLRFKITLFPKLLIGWDLSPMLQTTAPLNNYRNLFHVKDNFQSRDLRYKYPSHGSLGRAAP